MRAVLDSEPTVDGAAAAEAPHEAVSDRPGPIAWTAWILFFSITFLLDSAPYLPTLFGGKGAPIKPGLLDDPQMIVFSVVGVWISLAVVLLLAWRSRLSRRDLGLVGLPARTLGAWAGLVFAGLAVTGVLPSMIFGDKLGVVEAITRPPQGLAHWCLWILLALSAGVAEEVMMRGYGIGFLMRAGANRWGAAVGMSIYFGLLHAYQGLAAVPVIAVWGFLFAYSYLKTGSILPGIIAHTLVDGMAPLFVGK